MKQLRRMSGILVLFFTCALLGMVLTTTPPGSAVAPPASARAPHVPGEVLVKLRPDAGPADRLDVMSRLGGQSLRQLRGRTELMSIAPGLTTDQAIARLRGHPKVEFIEPNYIYEASLFPDDPRYAELYGLNNTGQTGGTPGADIDAERAWNVSTGSRNVLVAVIDTGVDYNHPDLVANIWINPGEIPNNGIDDDLNGFIDDVRGWDFVNDDNDPMDDHYHGTHVSGTIGAVGNNSLGVTGVAWQVSIVGIKFLNSGGRGTTADAISAVDYATSIGVDIMSNSWGGGGFSLGLLDAIQRANDAGIVFVAAAGNRDEDNDLFPHYPSSYDVGNVVAVAATDHNDNRAGFSSFGLVSVDLGAPGVDTLSTLPNGAYGLLSGTSMATPHVSGAAALVLAVAPDLSVQSLKARLLDHVEPVGSMKGITVTGGRLNAFFPIADPDSTPPDPILDLTSLSPTSNTITLFWTATGDDGSDGTASSYDLRVSTSPLDETNLPAATRVTGLDRPLPSGSSESVEVTGLDPDTTYYFAIKAEDEWANRGAISNVASETTLPPPTFASSPAAFDVTMFSGQTSIRTLTLTNTGVGTLDWSIPLPAGPAGSAVAPMTLAKGEPDPRTGTPVTSGLSETIGGYRFVDSDEADGPDFAWHDIEETGRIIDSLDGDDQVSEPISLGFSFPFYENTYDQVRVSTDGWLSFTSTEAAYTNQPLPCAGAPENLIAGFWDDLDFEGVHRAVYQEEDGAFVVQFTDVPRFSGPGIYTFQIVLRDTGEILFKYLSMAGDLTSAMVGIQGGTGSEGLGVAFNTPYLHDRLAVAITTDQHFVTASPTSGRLFGGESQDVEVAIDASDLVGAVYQNVLRVESNDPLAPEVEHPVTLTVIDSPAIAITPGLLDFGEVHAGFARTLPLTISNPGSLPLTAGIASGDPAVSVAPSSFVVPVGSGIAVQVTYSPSIAGTLAGSLTVTSDAPAGASSIEVEVVGTALASPGIEVSPSFFSEALPIGGSVSRSLRITNSTGVPLEATFSTEQQGSFLTAAMEWETSAKGVEADVGQSSPIRHFGGPDQFGYIYRDSESIDGPDFEWVDIAATGTGLSIKGDDDLSEPVSLGFEFPFYGELFTSVTISTNGWLTFTDGPTSASLVPGHTIAPFADDLDFKGSPRAIYLADGSRFVLQYQNVDRYTGGSDLTFQVVLEPSGRILFQYLEMSGVLDVAKIGLRDGTGSGGLVVSHNRSYVNDHLAVEIVSPPGLSNGGFEQGTFGGWVAATNGRPAATPWQVGGAGRGAFENTAPLTGLLDAHNGFDGAAGLEYVLYRDLVIPERLAGATLSFSDRIQFDGQGIPSSLPRIYEAALRDLGGATLAVLAREEIHLDGSSFTDLGWQRRSVDLSPFAGQAVRLHVREYIPESYTGPASIELDDFRLDLAPMADWLDVSPLSATIPPGGFQDLTVSFDATQQTPAVLVGAIRIDTNVDPSVLRVPATLEITGSPDILLSGEQITLVSSQDYTVTGAATHHELPVTIIPSGGGTVELIAEGDYGFTGETATLVLEGLSLGSVGGVGADCAVAEGTFTASQAQLLAAAADGIIQVDVLNSDEVHTFCVLNRHTVRLSYAGPADHIDFGTAFLGFSGSHAFTISNQGDDLLAVDSIVSDRSEYTVSLPATSLPAGDTVEVIVTFAPTSTVPVAGTLTITSNDPDTPVLQITLSGIGLEPPIADVQPTSLSSVLLAGNQETQSLTLSNLGGSPLEFSARVAPRAPGATGVPFAGLSPEVPGLSDNPPPFAPGPGVVEGARVAGVPGDFELLAPSPVPLTCIVADPVSNILYGQENQGTRFYRYLAAEDLWESLADAPVNSGNNGGAALLNGKIYTTYTTSGSTLGVYEIATDTWQQIPRPLALTGNIASDGSQFLYLVAGSQFVRLDPETGEIVQLASPPFFFERWGGLEHIDGVLYGHQGNGTQDFGFYDIALNSWTVLPAVPAGAVLGAAIDPLAREYIAYGSYGGTNLYRYDLDSGIWSTSSIPFFTLDDGGMGWLPEPVTGIYFVQGQSGTGLARLVTKPVFLSVSPSEGIIAAQDSLNLEVTFDGTNLVAGLFEADVQITSNDPAAPLVTVPSDLTVIGAPSISISGGLRVIESMKDYTTTGALTTHVLFVGAPPADTTRINLIADGDYGSFSETATATAEGLPLGAVGGVGLDCAPASGSFGIGGPDLAALLADGIVHVEVQNSASVNPFCEVNRHTVRLAIENPPGQLDFGSVFIGFGQDLTFEIRNEGTDTLEVTSLTSDRTEFSPSDSALSIPARRKAVVTVTFDPTTTGQVAGTLTIMSNDPDTPEVELQLSGAGLEPPVMNVQPASLASVLFEGSQEIQTLSVSNTGRSPLEFFVSVRTTDGLEVPVVSPTSGTVQAGETADLDVLFDTIGLIPGLYEASIDIVSNDPGTPLLTVPASLTVLGSPKINAGEILVSARDYAVSGARTIHDFDISLSPSGDGSLSLLAEGDYGTTAETAEVIAEGLLLGTVGGVGRDCVPASGSFPIDASDLAALAADGRVHVEVQNSPGVHAFCRVNRHTVTLMYPLDLVDFGSIFAGTSKSLSLTLFNTGTDVLEVSSITSDLDEYTVTPTALTIPQDASSQVMITFSPPAPASFDGTLSIASNDRDTPVVDVSLRGIGLEPPVVNVQPSSLSSTLTGMTTEIQPLTVRNEGGSTLEFSVVVTPRISGLVISPPDGLSPAIPGSSNNPPPSESGTDPLVEAPVSSFSAAFELLAPSPVPLTAMVADAASSTLYAQADGGVGFFRYVAAGDLWESLADAPISSGNNGGAALLNGKIYTAYTGNGTSLGVYEIATDTWSTVEHPLGAGTGNIASDGSRFLYLVAGTELARLDPVTQETVLLSPPPFAFERWGGLRHVDGILYGHQGNGTRGFASYDIDSDTWTVLPPLPSGGVLGAVIDPENREYVAYGSYGAANLYRYSLDSGTWRISSIPAFPVGDGSLGWLAWPVPGVYLLEGEGGGGLARSIEQASFLSVDPDSGSVKSGESITLDVVFDSTEQLEGLYEADISILSNDPVSPVVNVSANLNVIGIPDLVPPLTQIELESTKTFTGLGARTVHSIPSSDPVLGDGTLRVDVTGNYQVFFFQKAIVYLEGMELDRIAGNGPTCHSLSGTSTISKADLKGFLADGALSVEIQNTGLVGDYCPVNEHKVVLGYPVPLNTLDFGTVNPQETGERVFVFQNEGNGSLEIAFSTDRSEFSSPASVTIPPKNAMPVVMSFHPTTGGLLLGTLSMVTNDPDTPLLEIGLRGVGFAPPQAAVDPLSFEVALPPGGKTTRRLELTNTGGDDLSWTLGLASSAVAPGTIGPDAYGYRFRDSDAALGPAFSWEEIADSGTLIPMAGDDENFGPIPIGFNFPFYGSSFDTLRVSTNGWVSLTSSEAGFTNRALPDPAGPENLLALFWDDLTLDGGGRVTYQGDASRFIVQYSDVQRLSTGGELTFQLLLHPDGSALFQYLTMDGVLDSATIGVQNEDGTIGQAVSHNTTYVQDAMAVELLPPPGWLTASGTMGVLTPGEVTDITLEFDTTGLPDGDHLASIIIASNDPNNPEIVLPVVLHAGEVVLDFIDVEPNTLNLASNGTTVRGQLQLPAAYDPRDVLIESVTINEQLHANTRPIAFVDETGDGVDELMVKFDRSAFEALLPTAASVPVTVTGEVKDTIWFTGTDIIRTLHPQLTSPNGGEYFVAGDAVPIAWTPPDWNGSMTYELILSRDGGETWEPLASDVDSTSFMWTATGDASKQLRVRVFAVSGKDVLGYDTSESDFILTDALTPPGTVDTLGLDADPLDVILTWEPPTPDLLHGPAQSYRVLLSTSAQGPFEEIGTTLDPTFRVPHGSHLGIPIMHFKVIASNTAGDSTQ